MPEGALRSEGVEEGWCLGVGLEEAVSKSPAGAGRRWKPS